jgi:hypothetical protein
LILGDGVFVCVELNFSVDQDPKVLVKADAVNLEPNLNMTTVGVLNSDSFL